MCLDECPEPLDRKYNEEALTRTHAWAARCRTAKRRPDQALFGIVQGGIFPDLRVESARTLRALDFPGYAIGGLSVGETKEQMYATLDVTVPELPADKPRYLMGVGAPEDIVEGVARGIDIFDCVLPTRVARNGGLLTRQGRMNLRNARYAADPLPIEPGCDCYACQHFSRAYLRHLFKTEEILGLHLATVHNVRFMIRLMDEIRQHIAAGTFAAFRSAFLAEYRLPDQDVRHAQKRNGGSIWQTANSRWQIADDSRQSAMQAMLSAISRKDHHEHHPGHHPRHRPGCDGVRPGEQFGAPGARTLALRLAQSRRYGLRSTSCTWGTLTRRAGLLLAGLGARRQRFLPQPDDARHRGTLRPAAGSPIADSRPGLVDHHRHDPRHGVGSSPSRISSRASSAARQPWALFSW